MSADNHLLIEKNPNTGKYEVWDMWEEQLYQYPEQKPIAIEDTLVGAINKARDYTQEHIVEYGIKFGAV